MAWFHYSFIFLSLLFAPLHGGWVQTNGEANVLSRNLTCYNYNIKDESPKLNFKDEDRCTGAYWCKKSRIKKGRNTQIVRECITEAYLNEWQGDGAGFGLWCDHANLFFTEFIDCFCDTDLCNGSPAPSATRISAVIISAFLTIVSGNYRS